MWRRCPSPNSCSAVLASKRAYALREASLIPFPAAHLCAFSIAPPQLSISQAVRAMVETVAGALSVVDRCAENLGIAS
jgi:hypothetical protein